MMQPAATPATVLSDAARTGTKMLTGGKSLGDLRDADVQIATTPKELVWNQDTVSLFRYRPLAEQRVNIPVLICYGPGEAAKQWMKDLYQQNELVRNEWALDGRRIDLGNIIMPVLNVYANDDHIIPPATSRALALKVGTKDYNELALPGGHVGVFVGNRSQTLFAPAVQSFLARHDR